MPDYNQLEARTILDPIPDPGRRGAWMPENTKTGIDVGRRNEDTAADTAVHQWQVTFGVNDDDEVTMEVRPGLILGDNDTSDAPEAFEMLAPEFEPDVPPEDPDAPPPDPKIRGFLYVEVTVTDGEIQPDAVILYYAGDDMADLPAAAEDVVRIELAHLLSQDPTEEGYVVHQTRFEEIDLRTRGGGEIILHPWKVTRGESDPPTPPATEPVAKWLAAGGIVLWNGGTFEVGGTEVVAGVTIVSDDTEIYLHVELDHSNGSVSLCEIVDGAATPPNTEDDLYFRIARVDGISGEIEQCLFEDVAILFSMPKYAESPSRGGDLAYFDGTQERWVSLRAEGVAVPETSDYPVETLLGVEELGTPTPLAPKWKEITLMPIGDQGDVLYWEADPAELGEDVSPRWQKLPAPDPAEYGDPVLKHDGTRPRWEEVDPDVDPPPEKYAHPWKIEKAVPAPENPEADTYSVRGGEIVYNGGRHSLDGTAIVAGIGANNGDTVYLEITYDDSLGTVSGLLTLVAAASDHSKVYIKVGSINEANDPAVFQELSDNVLLTFELPAPTDAANGGDLAYYDSTAGRWIVLPPPSDPLESGEAVDVLQFDRTGKTPVWAPMLFDGGLGGGGGPHHEWKVEYAGEAETVHSWSVVGGDIWTQEAAPPTNVPDGIVTGNSGYVLLMITRDSASREITGASLVATLQGAITTSDQYAEYVALAYCNFAANPKVTQLQFERLNIRELMLVENGEFRLGPFRMSSNNVYAPPA